MPLKTNSKNKPVKVVVKRRFRYFKDGEKILMVPAKEDKKPNVVTLPFQFAREMEAAGKVSFEMESQVEVDVK